MKRIRLSIVVATICSALMLVWLPLASDFAKPAASPPATVKIGVLYEKTGPMAGSGKIVIWGFRKAIEDINKDGGVYVKAFDKKIPLELVEGDQEGNDQKAILRTQYLNEQGVVALIGTTGFLPGGAGITEKNHLPSMAILNGMTEPFEKGYRYLFRPYPGFDDASKVLSALLDSLPKDQRPAKVALIEEQHDFGITVCRHAERELNAHGYKTIKVKFPRFTKDLSAQILEMKAASGDVVYGATLLPDGMLLMKQMKELGYNPKLVGLVEAASNIGPWQSLGTVGDYVLSQAGWHHAFKFPGCKEFTAASMAETGEPPHPNSGAAYTSIQITAAAIERAGTLDREKVRDAISAIDMMTISGRVKFRENGTPEMELGYVQWLKGKQVLIWPPNLREQAIVYPMKRWDQR